MYDKDKRKERVQYILDICSNIKLMEFGYYEKWF